MIYIPILGMESIRPSFTIYYRNMIYGTDMSMRSHRSRRSTEMLLWASNLVHWKRVFELLIQFLVCLKVTPSDTNFCIPFRHRNQRLLFGTKDFGRAAFQNVLSQIFRCHDPHCHRNTFQCSDRNFDFAAA